VISFGVSGAFLLSLVPDAQPRTPRLMMGPEALAPAAGPAIPIPVADIGAGAAAAARVTRPPFRLPRSRISGSRRTAGRASSPSATSMPFAPMRITHSSTTARRNTSATARSARWKRSLTPRSSDASIAATSSGWRLCRESAGRVRRASRSLANPCVAPSRSHAANIAAARASSQLMKCVSLADAFGAKLSRLAPSSVRQFSDN
jgi:hypothetical protein